MVYLLGFYEATLFPLAVDGFILLFHSFSLFYSPFVLFFYSFFLLSSHSLSLPSVPPLREFSSLYLLRTSPSPLSQTINSTKYISKASSSKQRFPTPTIEDRKIVLCFFFLLNIQHNKQIHSRKSFCVPKLPLPW